MADDKNDERPLHSDPDEEAIDDPTTSGAQEADETAWMMKEGVTIGIIAIVVFVAVAIALMQATGLVNLFAPFGDSVLGQWLVFAVLAAVALAVFAWSRVGV